MAEWTRMQTSRQRIFNWMHHRLSYDVFISALRRCLVLLSLSAAKLDPSSNLCLEAWFMLHWHRRRRRALESVLRTRVILSSSNPIFSQISSACGGMIPAQFYISDECWGLHHPCITTSQYTLLLSLKYAAVKTASHLLEWMPNVM